MPEAIKKDLIGSICGGIGMRFGGVSCKYYDHSTRDCNLLKHEKLEIIFGNGRCAPYKRLKSAVRKNLIRYRYLVKEQEYTSSISYILFNQLKKIHLKKGYNLAVLTGYIGRAARNEVQLSLQNERLIPINECGNCIFLTESKPYVCQRDRIEVLENGKIQFKENPFYLNKRKKTDKCKKGFKPYTSISINGNKESDNENGYTPDKIEELQDDRFVNKVPGMIEVERIKRLLNKRVIDAKNENTRKRYKRQYSVFERLHDLFSKGFLISKAIEIIAKEIGKDEKTVKRDIKDIGTFLSELSDI